MAYEILKTIVEAEAKALEDKKNAAQELEQRKQQAQAELNTLWEQTQKDGLRLAQETAQRAVDDSVATIQGIRREAQEACLAIRKQAENKKEEAIQAVMRKVVGTYGSN